MDLADRIRFFREKVLARRWFQISAFTLILAVSFGLFFLARAYLDWERLLLYGYLGVFVVNLVNAGTILFPLPGEAINFAAGAILNPLWVGLIASIGATIGELTAYAAGYWGRQVFLGEYSQRYARAEAWLDRYGGLAIFAFALVPALVFDLLALAAGSFRFPLWKFVLACWAGKVLRCLIAAYLGYLGWETLGFLPSLL
ncbi:MAG: VTT domain-containing protein [Dehalococcoidia bacterium]|nr:VTT domain-containing protein [Dehalococcoidia bacterium]